MSNVPSARKKLNRPVCLLHVTITSLVSNVSTLLPLMLFGFTFCGVIVTTTFGSDFPSSSVC